MAEYRCHAYNIIKGNSSKPEYLAYNWFRKEKNKYYDKKNSYTDVVFVLPEHFFNKLRQR